MSKVIKNMLYVIELKKGFRKVGEMRIEIDPYALDKYFFDDADRLEEVVENCDCEMLDIEKAINTQMADIRAHLKRLTNIDELKLKDEWNKKVLTEKAGIVVSPPSKEGKKHHEKLEKKWKKAEKKHAKKGKK